MAIAESQALLTAEQYAAGPDSERHTELVRGKVIEMSPAGGRHGKVCHLVNVIVGVFVAEHDLGHVFANDDRAHNRERNPDSVRGPDICIFQLRTPPRAAWSAVLGFFDIPPDVAFEVRSPNDPWSKLTGKASEYIEAGVRAVCILDPDDNTIYVQRTEGRPKTLNSDDDLLLPEIAESFRMPCRIRFGSTSSERRATTVKFRSFRYSSTARFSASLSSLGKRWPAALLPGWVVSK